ncbi:MAG: hypothetical protein QOJ50_2449 [Cryptosporangiaceae bacterium]|nr:hypothetical protein [Cryptosporangiaceae bacterium]
MRATRFAGFVLACTVAAIALLALCPRPGTLSRAIGELIQHPVSTVDAIGALQVATTIVAATAWLLLGWLVSIGSLVAASTAPGIAGRLTSAVARAAIPVGVRSLVGAVLGVALLTLVTPPGTALAAPVATAAPSSPFDLDWPVRGSAPPPPRPDAPRARVSPAPPQQTGPQHSAPRYPARPSPGHPNAARPPGRHDTAADPKVAGNRNPSVVVQSGDSLWSIAARRLGPGAADREIAIEWPRWWAANRDVIGADPALINPGQRLTPPAFTSIEEQSHDGA